MSDQMRCEACPYHDTMEFRMAQNEKDIKNLEECYTSIKKDVSTIVTGQAVMQQKFDNLRVPIWIIFGAVLLEIAKWLLSFTQSGTLAAAGVM